MVGTSVDVTERRRMEQALRDADRRKDKFLAMLGHELRNPLGVIHVAMDLFWLQLPENSPLHRTREAAERQTRILIRLVDDLLDSARITTGEIVLHRTDVGLRDVVQEAIEMTKSDFAQRHHQLAVEQPAAELTVEGDHGRLVQTVVNMLNNAARYTPDGGPSSGQ
jgi:signal transduction histidine kinase